MPVWVDQSAKSIVQTVQNAGAKVSGPIPLPTKINKFTVLRSPHVNKKSREQFEMRTHKRLIDILESDIGRHRPVYEAETSSRCRCGAKTIGNCMEGLIGQKVGMTQIFDEKGELVPITLIRIEANVVVARRTQEQSGYNALLLGTGATEPKRLTKPMRGQFESQDIAPMRHLAEFRDFGSDHSVGDMLDIRLFQDIGFVDVVGFSKGRGYQGVMKRHGFHGGRKTHGSKFHRAGGSTGMAATPSRVIKGTKMAGRMGHNRVTVQNLRVVSVDTEKQLLLVKGDAPGVRGGRLLVSRTTKG